MAEQEFLYKDLTYAIIGTTDGTDFTDWGNEVRWLSSCTKG
jgi:hypothetical protein